MLLEIAMDIKIFNKKSINTYKFYKQILIFPLILLDILCIK